MQPQDCVLLFSLAIFKAVSVSLLIYLFALYNIWYNKAHCKVLIIKHMSIKLNKESVIKKRHKANTTVWLRCTSTISALSAWLWHCCFT